MARANIYYTDQSMVACLQVSHQHLVMLNSSGSRGVSRTANHIRITKLVSDGLWHEFRVMHLARVKTNLNKKKLDVVQVNVHGNRKMVSAHISCPYQ